MSHALNDITSFSLPEGQVLKLWIPACISSIIILQHCEHCVWQETCNNNTRPLQMLAFYILYQKMLFPNMPHDLCMQTSRNVIAKTLSVAVRMNTNQNLFFSPFCRHTKTYQDDGMLETNRSYSLFNSSNLTCFLVKKDHLACL